MKLAREIIIKPVVTEKSVDLMQENKYCFKVAKLFVKAIALKYLKVFN